MVKIDNPRHSRPIDVHRWSDHPEVVELVDKIWDGYLPPTIVGTPGPKPKTSFRKQLRVVILDLYVAWLEDPELSIGVSMSMNSWKVNSRYNALHISKKIIPIIQALHAAGLLDMAKGSYSGPGARGNRTTRIRASEELQAMFREAKFIRDDVTRFESEEIIILKDEKDKLIEYADTDKTDTMREDLKAYNALIQSSFIDIATLEEPQIQMQPDIAASLVRIGPEYARSRRIFSRSNWHMNGRFYGGWWQRLDSDRRSRILIDDQPTVEVDFKGLHVAMLYAEKGIQLTHDPYDLGPTLFSGYPRRLVRTIIKRLALTAINAKEKGAAYKAFRESFPVGNICKRLKNERLDEFLEAFLERNPLLADYLFSDLGIRLMYLDSQITARIHKHFTDQDVPVLSIHDSYIIDVKKVAEMRQAMADASEAVVGLPLATSIKLPDLPEYSEVTDEQLEEHIENTRTSRCGGYMERLFAYQERTGRSISPVSTFDEPV